MEPFQKVAAPVFSPTECVVCRTHRDDTGFIDTLTEYPAPVLGRIYLCGSCVTQAGRAFGMLAPDQADTLTTKLAAAQGEITTLTADLAAESENKLVKLSDVKRLISPRGGYTPAA